MDRAVGRIKIKIKAAKARPSDRFLLDSGIRDRMKVLLSFPTILGYYQQLPLNFCANEF